MPPPYLDPNASLVVLRDDLVYLRSRVSRDERTSDLAKAIEKLLTDWLDVFTRQLAHWDAQTDAQAGVEFADDALDARVDAFAKDADVAVNGDHDDPRYRQYLNQSPSELKRPVLGGELEVMRDWHTLLEHEENAALKVHRKALGRELADADAATAARAAADAKNAAFRATGAAAKFVTRVFEARSTLWDEINKRLARTDGPDAAKRFFKAPPPPARTEAERAARAAAREKAREERAALAAKRKELKDKIRESRKELSGLGKKKKG